MQVNVQPQECGWISPIQQRYRQVCTSSISNSDSHQRLVHRLAYLTLQHRPLCQLAVHAQPDYRSTLVRCSAVINSYVYCLYSVLTLIPSRSVQAGIINISCLWCCLLSYSLNAVCTTKFTPPYRSTLCQQWQGLNQCCQRNFVLWIRVPMQGCQCSVHDKSILNWIIPITGLF